MRQSKIEVLVEMANRLGKQLNERQTKLFLGLLHYERANDNTSIPDVETTPIEAHKPEKRPKQPLMESWDDEPTSPGGDSIMLPLKDRELDKINAALTLTPQSSTEIALQCKLPKTVVQKHLLAMAHEGSIQKSGWARGTKYNR